MARLAPLYAPGIPQLVRARLARPLAAAHEAAPAATLNLIQDWLTSEAQARQIAMHGWAILPDRIVLLATPANSQAVPGLMQAMGRHMAGRVMHGRVFHDRYRSTLVEDSWVLLSLTWAESLAATTGLVDTPARWPWSSAQEHTGLCTVSGRLTDHKAYWELGNTPYARQAQYRALLLASAPEQQLQQIEHALQRQWALGDADFIRKLSSAGSRRAAPAARGRPRKPDDNTVTN